jgi:hypothetical protein
MLEIAFGDATTDYTFLILFSLYVHLQFVSIILRSWVTFSEMCLFEICEEDVKQVK